MTYVTREIKHCFAKGSSRVRSLSLRLEDDEVRILTSRDDEYRLKRDLGEAGFTADVIGTGSIRYANGYSGEGIIVNIRSANADTASLNFNGVFAALSLYGKELRSCQRALRIGQKAHALKLRG